MYDATQHAWLNNQPFSTHDADNDNWGDNCAAYTKSGWWHQQCAWVVFTNYYNKTSVPFYETMHWLPHKQLLYADMKLKRV